MGGQQGGKYPKQQGWEPEGGYPTTPKERGRLAASASVTSLGSSSSLSQ